MTPRRWEHTMTKAIKITNAQAEVLAAATRDYVQAQTDFETWFRTSYFCNSDSPFFGTFEEAVEKSFGWIARRDQPNDVEGYFAESLAFCKRYYDMFRSGIVQVHTSSHTLAALEKKGLIEIIKDGKRHTDTIRLLYV